MLIVYGTLQTGSMVIASASLPGLMIFVVTLAFNLVGEALRDVLDPRTARV